MRSFLLDVDGVAGFAAFVIFFSLPALAGPKYSITAPLGGPQSPYTELVQKLAKSFKEADLKPPGPTASGSPVYLQGYKTEGHEFDIGVGQWMTIEAPFAKVVEIIDDIPDYKNLFPDLEETKIVERDDNRLLTFWEQKIPFFFIPNVKFEMIYLLDDTRPGWKTYRYQLRKSGTIRFSDGVVFVHAAGNALTEYAEFDFLDADWGVLEKLAPGRIVRDSTEALFLSDAAVKLKAEHPDWTYKKIREESKRLLGRFPVDQAVNSRVPFTLPSGIK